MRKPMPRAFDTIPLGAWDRAAVSAIKALSRGKASEAQQVEALNFIIEHLAGTYDLSYRPTDLGGGWDTAFAEGRRMVGLELRKAVMQSFETLTGEKTEKA